MVQQDVKRNQFLILIGSACFHFGRNKRVKKGTTEKDIFDKCCLMLFGYVSAIIVIRLTSFDHI